MRFFEKACPLALLVWLTFLATAVFVKLAFMNYSLSDSFTMHELMAGIEQNDSRILEYIHSNMYPPPSQNLNPSTTLEVTDDNASNATKDVIQTLKYKQDGFFVECRAYDGELFSRTKELETKYNWSGILLEPDPNLFPKLLAKRRNAWLLNGCLSPDPISHRLDFLQKIKRTSQSSIGSLNQGNVYQDNAGNLWKRLKIPCFPLFSVTSVLNIKTIDYLILDTQGLELQILLNIPWSEIIINVISVGMQSVPEGAAGVTFFLQAKGYKLISSDGNLHTFGHSRILQEI